jgi:dTDP-4-amino-4,6-dideoxygalactose transaminase
MNVPFVDLKRAHDPLRAALHAAVTGVMDDAHYILGPSVTRLEDAFARFLGVAHAVGVSNGTDALRIALETFRRIRGNGSVITTPYTFFATAETVAAAGLDVVFVDVDPDTACMDPRLALSRIDGSTRGILPVHLFGQCADMDPLLAAARDRGLFLVEDVAQAFGARYRGRPAGAMGDVSCFSFFPSKNLGGAGDGGMVCTSDSALAAHLRSARAHGSAGKKYHHDFLSGNYRLDEIQAAILAVKLPHVEEWNRQRAAIGRSYDRMLEQAGLVAGGQVRPLAVTLGSDHVYHQYVVRAERRDALAAHLSAAGVGNAVYYAVPLHVQKAFAYLGHAAEDFPVSMSLSRTCIALPVFPGLSQQEQEAVVDSIVRFYGRHA